MANAQIVGRVGEEFINYYLEEKKNAGLIDSFDWISNTNAIAPYDFIIKQKGYSIYIDVKSTEGKFSSPIHISYHELLEMEIYPYQIYRVYAISNNEARLRIAENLGGFAKKIISIFKALPEHIKPDSINLPANELDFGEETII